MIKAVLFDFDGTLIDSDKHTLEHFNEALRYFNYSVELTDNELSSMGGLVTKDIWKKLLPNISDKKITEISQYAHEISLNTITNIETFPAVIDILKQLKNNYLLGLVTSRGKESTEILFNHYKLAQYFSCIVSKDDVSIHKPNPEGILAAIKKLHVSAIDTIYVGDSAVDIQTAHNAGIPCISIARMNNNFGADYQIKEITQLPALIKKL